jgi:hypothetical protein
MAKTITICICCSLGGCTPSYIMGANKHHCLVCFHTPQCLPINAHPNNLPTKLPPTKDTTHNLPTKLLSYKASQCLFINTPLTKLPTKLPPTPNANTNSILITTIFLHYKAISKIGMLSTHIHNVAITHTTQNTTHKGKRNHLKIWLYYE